MAASTLARVQVLLAAAVVLGVAGVLSGMACVAPQVAFLPPHRDDGWIGFPLPVHAGVYRTEQPPEPFVFTRHLELQRLPERAELEVHGLFRVAMMLNGVALLPEPRDAFRRPVRLDVRKHLRPGRNELHVAVWNPHGPGLMRLRLRDGDHVLLTSDARWIATAPGLGAARAIPATDTLQHPGALQVPGPVAALAEKARPVLVLLLVCTALVFVADGRLPRPAVAHAPLAILVLISAGWVLLLAGRIASLPLEVGFDAFGHLEYAARLRESRGLPLAPEGISMYHPPLFYALLAGVTALAGVEVGAAGAGLVHRLVPMGMGLGCVALVWLAARRLFPERPLRTALAVAFGGLLPMHFYMSAFVSNESTATFTASAFLTAAVLALLAARLTLGAGLMLALLGGLAMLAKNSTLALLPLGIGAVALRVWLVDGRSPARALGVGAALGGGCLVVGGWFYARNWILLGEPLPFLFSTEGEGLWWHLPGFHTIDYFTRFGESLRHPIFAGLHGYADGVYATFWGDAYVSGSAQASANPAGWARDWMMASYLLALPVSALALAGAVRAGVFAASGSDVRKRLSWTLMLLVLVTMAASHLVFSVRYPSYAATKAFYALPAYLPLALAAGCGLAWPLERLEGATWRPLRALYLGALLTFAVVLVLVLRG